MRLLAALGASVGVWAVGGLAIGAAPQRPDQLPISALPLQLTGVLVEPGAPARSACLIRCGDPAGQRGMFFTGQSACGVVEITEIREDGVVVRNLQAKRAEFLTFSGDKPPAVTPPPAPAPAVASPPDDVTVSLTKETVDHYLNNLSELLDAAYATPRYREIPGGQRAIDGYEITRVREGTVVEQVGLRNGDVILDVNGQRLDSLATVLGLVGQIQTMPQATVTVLRNGQRMTFVIKTK
jgi:type II secretory pathway component PulC